MPAGTYPAGQQPLNGDSYYDVTTGTEVQFRVAQNAPVFTLKGTIGDVAANQVGANLGPADLTNWPGTRTATPLPAFWYAVFPAPVTPTSGVFAGRTFAAGNWLFGYSGDPDAQNSGWIAAQDAAGIVNWTLTTPHPQAVPDTITPTVVWGTRRNFNIQFGASAVEDAKIILLTGIPRRSAVTHFELRELTSNASVFEFDVVSSATEPAKIIALAVQSKGSHIKAVQARQDATNVWIDVVAGPGLANERFTLEVQTNDYDIGRLSPGTGNQVETVTANPADELNTAIDSFTPPPYANSDAGGASGTMFTNVTRYTNADKVKTLFITGDANWVGIGFKDKSNAQMPFNDVRSVGNSGWVRGVTETRKFVKFVPAEAKARNEVGNTVNQPFPNNHICITPPADTITKSLPSGPWGLGLAVTFVANNAGVFIFIKGHQGNQDVGLARPDNDLIAYDLTLYWACDPNQIGYISLGGQYGSLHNILQ